MQLNLGYKDAGNVSVPKSSIEKLDEWSVILWAFSPMFHAVLSAGDGMWDWKRKQTSCTYHSFISQDTKSIYFVRCVTYFPEIQDVI